MQVWLPFTGEGSPISDCNIEMPIKIAKLQKVEKKYYLNANIDKKEGYSIEAEIFLTKCYSHPIDIVKEKAQMNNSIIRADIFDVKVEDNRKLNLLIKKFANTHYHYINYQAKKTNTAICGNVHITYSNLQSPQITISCVQRGINAVPVIQFFNNPDINLITETKIVAHSDRIVGIKTKEQNTLISPLVKKIDMETDMNVDVVLANYVAPDFEIEVNQESIIEAQIIKEDPQLRASYKVSKTEYNAEIEAEIVKNDIDLIVEQTDKANYLIDYHKTSIIRLNEGYNQISAPLILFNKKILHIYDLLFAIAKKLNKKLFDLFEEAYTIQDNQKIVFVISEEYITNPEGKNNFMLFKINDNEFTPIGFTIKAKTPIEINAEDL